MPKSRRDKTDVKLKVESPKRTNMAGRQTKTKNQKTPKAKSPETKLRALANAKKANQTGIEQ